MKKHTRLTLLFGIVFCYASLSIASDNDNGPYSPAKVIPAALTFLKASAVSAISTIITHECIQGWNKVKKSNESYWEYFTSVTPKLRTISRNQLRSRPDLNIDRLKSLPINIQSILDKDAASGTNEHKMILLYGKPGTGKTTVAQQIALSTGGNYYHVHQANFDNCSDPTVARWLRSYIKQISDETKDGTVSILHLEEFGKQLGLSNNDEVHNMKHGSFDNTWKMLLEFIEKESPKVRVIACTNHEEFNAAIANERAHIIRVQAPDEIARKVYLTITGAAHLKNQGIKHADCQTQEATTQKSRNQILSDNFFVTEEMHEHSRKEHENKIAMITPGSMSNYIWPTTWVEAWNKLTKAPKISSQGYVTPVVSWDCNNATEQKQKTFTSFTQYLRYRQLNNITEDARIDKLKQIKRMKKYTEIHNGKLVDIAEDAQKKPLHIPYRKLVDIAENPRIKPLHIPYRKLVDIEQNARIKPCAYIVNPKDRTYSITTTDYDKKNLKYTTEEITITAPFGKVQPHNMIAAASNEDPLKSLAQKYARKKRIE